MLESRARIHIPRDRASIYFRLGATCELFVHMSPTVEIGRLREEGSFPRTGSHWPLGWSSSQVLAKGEEEKATLSRKWMAKRVARLHFSTFWHLHCDPLVVDRPLIQSKIQALGSEPNSKHWRFQISRNEPGTQTASDDLDLHLGYAGSVVGDHSPSLLLLPFLWAVREPEMAHHPRRVYLWIPWIEPVRRRILESRPARFAGDLSWCLARDGVTVRRLAGA